MKSLWAILLVGGGGALGSIVRYEIGVLAARYCGPRFPMGTAIVNVTGCLLIGLVATLVARGAFPAADRVQLAISIGFLGGYTTFSTYSLETFRLLNAGEWQLALLNSLGSLLLGIMAVMLGVLIARAIN
jgi:CrcB protein